MAASPPPTDDAGDRRGPHSLSARGRRLRERAFFIVQCAASAGIAWFVAGTLLHHSEPFFAPVAALVALGQSFGQRLRRVAEIVVGVAVGVFVGDVFVTTFGAGVWQLAVVIAVSMAAATLLDAGVLMTTQAGVQAAFVTLFLPQPGMALGRWLDAVVGGVVALAAATVTPPSPVRRPRQRAAVVLDEVAAILTETAQGLGTTDRDLLLGTLDRARRSEHLLDSLRDASDDGLAVVRSSPFRRGSLPAVQAVADLLEPTDRAIRNLRVLVRRAYVAVDSGEEVPAAYVALVSDLGTATSRMADSLRIRELPESARPALTRLAEQTRHVAAHPSLSSEVIRAQVRSMIVDLLMVTGLNAAGAAERVPDGFELDR